MNPIKSLLFLLIIFSFTAFPQNKKLTLEQVTVKPIGLYPQTLSQLKWRPGNNAYTYVESKDDRQNLVEREMNSDETKNILSVDQLNTAAVEAGLDSIKRFPRYEWIDKNNIRFWQKTKLVKYNLEDTKAEILNTIDEKGENLDYTAENSAAYTIKNNLYISVNGEQKQVTSDENEGIVNGQAVHRNEFGITKGTFWSPKSNYLAFYRMDQTMVTDYPLVDISTRPASVVNIKYPMAGMTSHQVTVGVYNIKNGNTVWLKTGEPKDQYLTCVTWGPEEKYIYIAHLNRDQNHMRLIKYDASTGEPVKTLFEEEDDKYVEPEHGLIFVKDNPDEFIWFSERDKWTHLYLYNTEGELIRKLTDGPWEVTEFDGFDEDGENIFITSTKESPIERHFYKIELDNAQLTKLTKDAGTHNVRKDENGEYFLDEFTSLTLPYEVRLFNEKGKDLQKVYSAEEPLKDYAIGKTRIFTIKDSAGYDLYCRMITPPDFDSTKKYPVMVYVYGGPHVQLVNNRWLGGGSLWFNYMAENGYIVFTLDNRGSANRGLKFEQETFRHLGTAEIQDQATGVNYLKSLAYVDTARLGVFGWSFGGFMTTSLMTRTPDLFKVGVAGGAVIDWSYYEVMYTERYMDTPQANPEGYKESNLLNYVGNLKGKLLQVHGTMDPTVVWQHDLMFVKKAADLGIPLDYFPYPGQEHGVRGIDVFHLYQKITNYFNTNL